MQYNDYMVIFIAIMHHCLRMFADNRANNPVLGVVNKVVWDTFYRLSRLFT